MDNYLEVFFAKIINNEVFYQKEEINITREDQDPQDILIRILKNQQKIKEDTIKKYYLIHSTSWRFEKPSSIVLTYIIYSDFLQFPHNTLSLNIEKLKLAKGSHNYRPRPIKISERAVLSHALRHLGYLMRTDRSGLSSNVVLPNTISVLRHIDAVLAGQLK